MIGKQNLTADDADSSDSEDRAIRRLADQADLKITPVCDPGRGFLVGTDSSGDDSLAGAVS